MNSDNRHYVQIPTSNTKPPIVTPLKATVTHDHQDNIKTVDRLNNRSCCPMTRIRHTKRFSAMKVKASNTLICHSSPPRFPQRIFTFTLFTALMISSQILGGDPVDPEIGNLRTSRYPIQIATDNASLIHSSIDTCTLLQNQNLFSSSRP